MSENAPDLLRFIGHFHPLVVHLPIGGLIIVAALEAAALRPAWRPLAVANRAILWITAPAAVLAAACGWLLAADGGYDAALLAWHRWTGVGTAALTVLLLALHHFDRPLIHRLTLAVTLAALGAAGHYGGSLTHGSDFLTRNAPEPLRGLLGSPPVRSGSRAAMAPADPLTAPVYESFIQPMLATYCTSCHGAEKVKGGLRVHTAEALARGGENGPAVIPGKSGESPLLSRIRLPVAHDEHMPPEGKTQPGADDLTLLAWWIDAGGVAGRSAADLQAPDPVRRILLGRVSAAKR